MTQTEVRLVQRSESLPAAAAPPAAVPPSVSCSHCGLPVPGHAQAPGEAEQFCCRGCQIVYSMLREHSLGQYYGYREQAEAEPAAAQCTGRGYEEFDDPAFLEANATRDRERVRLELLLEGVHCSACIWLVEKLPELVEGVNATRLDYTRRVAEITFAEGQVQPSQIAQTLDRLGYPPHPHRPGESARLLAREQRDLLLRLGVAGASAGNCMLLALALYSGVADGTQQGFSNYFRWVSAVVALPALLWSAQIFYRGAVGALRARAPHMDIPVSLGILSAGSWGAVNVVRGQGEIYFDSVTMLIFLLTAGRYLQLRQRRSAEDRAGSARALTPRSAHLREPGGKVREVPTEALRVGHEVLVRAGECFPVDGQIVEGRSNIDLSWLTGESRPESAGPRDAVHAGTTNLSGPLRIVATQTGAQTRAARLMKEVEQASSRRPNIALMADRLSAYFLVSVVALATGAFFLWLDDGLDRAVDTAVAMLIVTCPCALGLATPLAVSSALGQAARDGWLVKGGHFLEALARPSLIVFDKTGTLTTGEPKLLRWVGDEALKAPVKGLEQNSNHPTARALVAGLEGVSAARVERVHSEVGRGIEGRWRGQQLRVGSVGSHPEMPPRWARQAIADAEAEGASPLLVSLGGAVRAVMAVGDPPRRDAPAALTQLVRAGHQLAVLSGDREAVVKHVTHTLEQRAGRKLFERSLGERSPEQKLAWLESVRERRPVVMIGDGVNDAAALAAATVGIAVHGGAEASIVAADAFSTRPGVQPVARLLAGARRSLGVIRLNLGLSLAYNALAASLTLAGAVSPLLAAVLMPLSSLSVVSHSYRRRMFPSLS